MLKSRTDAFDNNYLLNQNKTIFIYGYSNAYGRYENQHEKSVEMLKEVFPDYKITCSNEGY